MSNPMPKAMPETKSGGHIELVKTAPTNKKDNIKNNPIKWKVGPKLDQYDVLITVPDNKKVDISITTAGCLPHKYKGLNGYNIYEKSYAKYMRSKGYAINGIQLFTLRCQPLSEKLPYIKVTTVPAEISRFNKLGAFEDLFDDFMSKAIKQSVRVSRADFAYDMEVNGSTLVWYSERAKKSFLFVDKHGELSFYLGSKKGQFQGKIYNKKKALWEKRGIRITQKHMLRLELLMRSKYLPQFSEEGLKGMKNPLLSIRPYVRLGVINWLKKNGYADRVTDVFELGLNEAIKDLPLKERKAIVAALDQFAVPDWWKPQKMWENMVKHALEQPILNLLKAK